MLPCAVYVTQGTEQETGGKCPQKNRGSSVTAEREKTALKQASKTKMGRKSKDPEEKSREHFELEGAEST